MDWSTLTADEQKAIKDVLKIVDSEYIFDWGFKPKEIEAFKSGCKKLGILGI